MKTNKTMQKIISLCKNRGLIYPSSEIYGGISNTWDYGPLGAEIKNNVKRLWWKKFIEENHMNVGLDSAILMNPYVWTASGHIENFSDPLVDCKECKSRFRVDELIKENFKIDVSDWSIDDMENCLKRKKLKCLKCEKNNFTEIRKFNLMFETSQGTVENNTSKIFLRPETAQGIFVNFKNVLRTTRKKIPFGIGQIGKCFRNEITPGNFTFRTREFEQMELEFFCKPEEDKKWFEHWKIFCFNWLLDLGIDNESLRIRDHTDEELSHYSIATSDVEFLFPFGWGELWGISNRGDFDLKNHSKHSNKNLEYTDLNEKYTPFCIEPSLGVDRVILAFLINAFEEETLDQEKNDFRTVLKLHSALAPIKAAILPLTKKLSARALEIFNTLSKEFTCDYDESGSIGKRYRRYDEIGTPFCITYDFDSENEKAVTVRERDSMKQEKIPINKLQKYISDKIKF
ncbi:MAG: glycine--tRNA ligase [Clostridiales bacterium]|nr:glycine--tRNA ligase [Clostridiales bacterium]